MTLFAAPAYEGKSSLDVVCDTDQVLSDYMRQLTALDHTSQLIRRAQSTLDSHPDSFSSGLTIPRGMDLQASRSIISKIDISTISRRHLQVWADAHHIHCIRYGRVVPCYALNSVILRRR